MHFQPGFLGPRTAAVTFANLLLSGETDGFAIDATDVSATPSYTGASYAGYVSVIDTGTPANNLSNAALDSSNLVNTGTSPKMVPWNSSPYLRWTPHNRVATSQALDSWGKGGNITITADATTAPDGTSTADLITATGSSAFNGSNYVFVVGAGSGTHTSSIWLKRKTGTGDVYLASPSGLTGNIVVITSSWARYEVSGLDSGANVTCQVDVVTSGDEVYAWGGQVNKGPVATPYITTTSVARNGIPQAYDAVASKYGILTEPAATNLALYSDDFTNAAWTKSNMTTAFTSSGPDGGTNNASRLTASAGNATALQAITSGSSARITSFWVKRITGSGNIDLTQDNGSTWQTMTVTGSWTRVNLTAATLANPTVGIRIVTNTDAVDVFGFQHEVGSVATSTIPTIGSSVTRAKDIIRTTTSSNPYGSSMGFWASCKLLVQDDAVIEDFFSINKAGDSGNNAIDLWQNAGEAGFFCDIWSGGGLQARVTPSHFTAAAYKIGFRAATNDFAVYKDGSSLGTDTSVTMPSGPNRMEIGYGTDVGAIPANMYIYQLAFLPRIYDNTELATLTT